MPIVEGKKIKIFSLNANRPLAEEIAKTVGVELAECQVQHFADGEINLNIGETVRGHHVFVVQPTQAPVNDNLMEFQKLLRNNGFLRELSDATSIVENTYRKVRE